MSDIILVSIGVFFTTGLILGYLWWIGKKHKRVEAALRESESRFRIITEANPVPIVISRMSDGLILYANAHLDLIFGLSPDTVVGQKTPDFYYDPADRQVMLDMLEERGGHLRNYEVRAKKADGTRFWVIASLQTIIFDGEPALFSGFYDISERKEAEEGQRKALAETLQATNALRESEARNQAILDAIPDMMFRFHKDGTYLEFKAAKGQEPLIPPSEFLGKAVTKVMPPEVAQQTMHYLERVRQDGDMQIFEYQLPLKDGVHHYEARLVVCGAQGDEVLAIVRDTTQRKAREALLEAERARIARDLHDGLAQSLYFLGLKLDYRRGQGTSASERVPGESDTSVEMTYPHVPFQNMSIEAPDITPLTELELAILCLVAQGLSNNDIGKQLGLAEKTIGNRLTVIFDKLHVNNRVQATLFALRQGLTSLEE